MIRYEAMTPGQRKKEMDELNRSLDMWKSRGLKLNMARGKPGADQLALSNPMLDVVNSGSDCNAENGSDCRNYGELLGIPEARKLFGEYMGVRPEETIVVGSASLNFIYDSVARGMLTGVLGSEKPWGRYDRISFLCPVPGYDRHFSICEFLGINMINIPMDEDGPDMDLVESLVAEDDTIKGIMCVPKYTNPMGTTYSGETVRRLAGMKTKAPDFRIFWDNAYAEHFVYEDTPLLNLLEECKKVGNPNRAYMYGSTSKITFPGAGVGFFAASEENIRFIEKQVTMQIISWDKMNMLRHVRFFRDMDGIRAHMARHAGFMRPKFDTVANILEKELSPLGIGSCVKPKGGYFMTYIAPRGCAKRIVGLCKDTGVVLTGAGATHPYKKDPDDSYIRIAPSFPPLDELEAAMEIFCIAAKIAYLETLGFAS